MITTLNISGKFASTVSQALLAPVGAAAKVLAAELDEIDSPADPPGLFAALFPVDPTPTAENLELIRLSREAVNLTSDAETCAQLWAEMVAMYRADIKDEYGVVQGALGDA